MKNKKVLIVDDNALNRRVFEHIIGQVCIFEVAENGKEALEKLKGENFDLILMDIQMPVMDGITTLRHIKSQQLSNAPTIAVSAFASENDREYFLSTGFDDFIAKPIKPRVLLETLGKFLHIPIKTEATETTKTSPFTDLDTKVVDSLLKFNSKENIRTVYEDFLEESKRILQEIDELIAAKEFDQIGEKLHIIKGNAGTLGALKIYKFVESFEKNIKLRQFDNTPQEYLYLKSLFEGFVKHFESSDLFNP